MKRLLTILLTATLILNGCTHNKPFEESEPTTIPETTEATFPTEVTEAEMSVPEETGSFSQPVTEAASTTEAADIQSARTSTEETHRSTEPVDEKKEPSEIRPKKEEFITEIKHIRVHLL